MASPDFVPYIDLTVYDTDPTQIEDDALQYARLNLPEFNPRNGTVENAIIEAAAYMTNNMVLAINRLPNGLMEGLLTLMGYSRTEATRSTGVVEIQLTSSAPLGGVTIVAGTVFAYDVFDSGGALTQYLFETLTDFTIPEGSSVGSTTVQGVAAQQYPDIPVPQLLTVVSATPYILEVNLTTLTTVGTNSETDEEYFDRGKKYLASLSAAIVTSSQMTNYIAQAYPTIGRFKVYDLTDSTNLLFSASNVAGKVTVALCDQTGDPLTTAQKTTVSADVNSRVVAGLDIDLVDMVLVSVDVTATVSVVAGYSSAEVSQNVSTAIEQYLSVAGWDWAQSVDSRILSSIASRVEGVKYVDSVDASLETAAPLYATDAGNDVTLLRKGVIPIGSCTTTAS